MTTNEVLIRYNFLTKIPFKSGESELSKDLKVKIMSMRIEYGKVRKQFDEDLQEFVRGLSPDELQELQQKQNRTDEENAKLTEMINKLNAEYQDYINKKGAEEVTVKNDGKFTEDEYSELVAVCPSDDIDINGTKLNGGDFLEILYSIFVNESK
jgi:predicted nuclease with TOPRIM domain